LLDHSRVTPSVVVINSSRSSWPTSRVHGTGPVLVTTSRSNGRVPTGYEGAPASAVTAMTASPHGKFGSGGGGGGAGGGVGLTVALDVSTLDGAALDDDDDGDSGAVDGGVLTGIWAAAPWTCWLSASGPIRAPINQIRATTPSTDPAMASARLRR
jgi:hypothetical protein